MEFGFSKENLNRTLWHLVVVAGCAAVLAVLNSVEQMNLDPRTLAVLALVSPTVKAIIEGFRKG